MQEKDLAYEVIFDEEAIKFLNRLQKHVRKRIFDKIISTKTNPFHFFEKLDGRTDYKLRIGNYRAIADIQNKNLAILVIKVGHRRNIYNKPPSSKQ